MSNEACDECKHYFSCAAAYEGNSICDDFIAAVPLTHGDVIRKAGDREFAEYFVYDTGAMWASTVVVDKTFNTYEEAVKATEDYLNASEESEVNSDVLKPCPFCGSGAIDVMAWENSTDISCLDCDYTIKCCDCDEEDAVDYWNTRPAEDALTAKVERLKAALKDMCELWESMGKQIPPLLNELRYIHAKASAGKDINVLTEESEGEDK